MAKAAAAQAGELWITRAEAAQKLKVSIRGLERRAAAGHVRKRAMPRDATNPQGCVLYAAADVDALANGHPGSTAGDTVGAVPAAVTPRAAVAVQPGARNGLEVLIDRLLTGGAAAIAAPASRPWLTLAEAAEYSGLPVAWLKLAAAGGQVNAIDVRTPGAARPVWRFHRDTLASADVQYEQMPPVPG